MKKPPIYQKSPIPVDVEKGKVYLWCGCGKSEEEPFCDGSHRTTPFTSRAFVAEKTGTVHLCGCKQTKTPPFCDGTHKEL